jgi:von Willebrand factor type A domain
MGFSGAPPQSTGGSLGIHDAGPDALPETGGAVGSGGRQNAGGVTSEGGPPADTGTGGKMVTPISHPFAMFIMLDRSLSMTMPVAPATTASWDNAVAALTAFVNDPGSAGIDIGLGTFPVGAQNTFDCAAGMDCGTPVVPIAPLPANGKPMLDAMTAQYPMGLGFTPTECGLRGMVNGCLTYMAASKSGERCVGVLVTDGVPTQCNTDEAALTAIIADGKMRGVTTFALGLAGADVNVLNQYATAGGSNIAIDVSSGPASFTEALKKIRQTQM